MAEFRMAYPGLDPLSCTFATFEMYVRQTEDTKKWLNNHWTEEDVVRQKGKRDNQTLIWKHHLPSYYDDPFAAAAQDIFDESFEAPVIEVEVVE